MKKNLFNSVVVISVLALCVSCKKHSSTPAASNYKTLNVTTSDRTLYSNFSATIQGYAMPQVELWLSDRSEYPEKGKIDVISGTHAVVLWLHGKMVGDIQLLRVKKKIRIITETLYGVLLPSGKSNVFRACRLKGKPFEML